MPARRNPRWTPSEIAALREVYPGGGLKGALERLPHRSWHSIHVKAQKLGIRCDMTKLCGGERRCKCAGADLETALRLRAEGWSFAKIGANLGFAESTISNAVLIHDCVAKGYKPAERYPNGRLTPAARERLRWMLKKGLKGVEIQLRLGVSAAAVHNERVRYNAELKANGKALLPPPGCGERYSGARIDASSRKQAERLFLDGYGTRKVSEMTGVSKTVCTRIRNRLIRRLGRKGECLPGCDANGKRRKMRDHARHAPDELKAKLRGLILERVPVRRAAAICGIGSCTAYKIRDAMKAELGDLPPPRLPGRLGPISREMMNRQAIPAGQLWHFRALVKLHGDEEARRILRAEMAETKRNRTFEQMVEAVAGSASIGAAFHPRAAGPDYTLGGVTGAIL
jgi:hypothetical protein